MKNYELIEERKIPEIGTDAVLYRHIKSGARVFTMKNDDDNKVFSIAFRTPAADSTGVAHIMEHSVLCGSDKFPLKDPFVELAKGSLNTFLNAMTYPDKTVYPVASRNDRDFDNLMDVYLDAVFHPHCLQDDHVFRQEGWHYELTSEDGPLIYNGVVYNEMKGAFSSPDAVLERCTLNSLYPDNTYRNESGGDPMVIPTLTYQDFCAFHDRYYHPSNSYIILYGDMDMEKKLDFLDREYLSEYDAIDPDSGILPQKPFTAMQRKEISYSVGKNEPTEKRTYLSLGISCGSELDAKMGLAMDILDYALLSAPGAPLRQALIDAGIGEDVYGGYEDGILQPYFTVTAKNADPEDADRFLSVIHDTLAELAEKGLDRKMLLAGLNHDEFQYREADYGRTPKGLVYALSVMDAWLYDGKPWTHLEIQDLYGVLRKELEEGCFEQLIREMLLDNPFSVLLTVRPEPGLTHKQDEAIRKRLFRRKKAFSAEEKQKLIRDTAELKRYQETPTPEEDLRKLPLLAREDISKKADIFGCREERLSDSVLLYTEENTRGIAYLRLNFNTSELSEEELPYAGLLRMALGYMDTKTHSYQDLSSDILLNTGGIGYSLAAVPKYGKRNHYTGIFSVDMKLFYDKIPYGLEIAEEILHSTKLEDRKRMTEILNEARSRERMRAESAGHTYAVNRAMSDFSGTARFAELTGGISYYHFIERAVEEYAGDPEGFTEKLELIAEKIFRLDNLFVSLTSEAEGRNALKKVFPEWKKTFLRNGRELEIIRRILKPSGGKGTEKPREGAQLRLTGPEKEGFRTPSQVNYVARAGWFDPAKLPYTGALRVLRVILNYEYLWINLRVKGGAYGCMSGFGRNGEGYLVSYRDPNLRETLEIYEALPAWLRQFSVSDRDMTKYIIGAISDMDMPKTKSAAAGLSVSMFLSGTTPEMQQKERDEVLRTTQEDIRKLADYMEAMLGTGAGCTIGNAEKVNRASSAFDRTADLFG